MNWTAHTLEVKRSDWSEVRVVEQNLTPPDAEHEVVFDVGRLALTSNNISYALSGDMLDYWGFFPAETGWGRIPAMGWATVIASSHPSVAVGERVWGFFPYTNYHKIKVGKVTPNSLSDVGKHRSGHAPVYCQFDRASANPIYEPDREDQDSLLRGLYLTSWLVEDFLSVNQQFGASSCLITSASSKTSIALAHAVKARGALRSIGITSPRNLKFCEDLGCYDQVVTYDNCVAELPVGPAVVVDMAGSAEVLSAIHHHYGDQLKHSCLIGATHYSETGSLEGLPGAKPEFFFAPTHVQTRSAELGAATLMGMLGQSYFGFRIFCDSWLECECAEGPDAAMAAYQRILGGTAEPKAGQLIDL